MDNSDLQTLKDEYTKPLILHVAAMKITDIGKTAEKIDRGFINANKHHESEKLTQLTEDASQLILGLYLRLSRNTLKTADGVTLREVAKYWNIDSRELTEYHFIRPSIGGINALLSATSGEKSVLEYIEKHGFMAGVKTIIKISNKILEVLATKD